MARTGREAAKAEAAQQRANTALRQLHAEARLDDSRQVNPTPAHHAVLHEGRPLANQPRYLRLLFGGQARLGTGRNAIGQSRKTEFVIPVHPIAQRLSIHAAQLCRLGPGAPLQHQCERQHPTRGVGVPRL